jgi:hypothetical protein
VTTPRPADPDAAATHVNLAASLFVVWGALTILIGVSTLALGLAAASLVSAAAEAGRSQFAAGLTAAAFTVLALLAVIWGAAHVAVGVQMRRRRHWSRHGAMVFATIDLLLLPYGTALGIYALWVLFREDSRRLFDEPNAARAS